MSFVMNGANTVSSFVMRSIISWNMFVPLDNTELAYDSLRMHTSHFMLLWKRGVMESAGFLKSETWLE